MGREIVPLLAFNRGILSPLALARTDFKRTAWSAEIQKNWMPRALGSMMLRPGMEYTGATRSNAKSVTLPFIFSTDDTARLEITGGYMRVWVDDALVTRPTVTTAVTNGAFDSDLTGWTDLDGGSSVSAWATGGYMSLIGTGSASARRRQQVTVSGGNVGVQHALTIVIERGPVILRVGSTAGGDEYIAQTTLSTGAHSLSFTPSADFYIDLQGFRQAASLVNSISVASSGVMEIPVPWVEADLKKIRWDQSGDVVFVACDGYRQRRIERRSTTSWSVVVYESDDGPFRIDNITPITLTPSGRTGDITLTASQALFTSGNIGSLFRLTQSGQAQSVTLTGEDQFSDSIRVVGVGAARTFAVIITGTWTGTVTLQYSTDDATWIDAATGSYIANASTSFDDTLDNQIIYYRIGIKTGNYGSGTANASLTYNNGSQTGIARVTGYTSATQVSAAVLSAFGKTTATSEWAESYWSERRGYPTAVAIYEGRMWWAGRDRIIGSVSDAYANFDDTTEGDSAPINRSIGRGPVDNINWIIPAQRLLLGAEGSIWSARSTSLDEPLTPTNFNLKEISDQGTAAWIDAVRVDTSPMFIQRSGTRLFSADFDAASYDYAGSDMTRHVPEIGEPSVVRVAVQRQPETRVHCVRSDGTVAILVFDKAEEINCWVTFETDGEVEDVLVLPGTVEDQVYYTVKRGSSRFHEKWALESDCIGGTLNKQADAFVTGTGSITGLGHLEGETVTIWADGEYRGEAVVSSGAVAGSYTSWIAGLPYTAEFKSTKMAYAVESGTSLVMKKRIAKLGIIARNIHPQGLKYGPDFDNLDDLPAVEDYDEIDGDVVREAYDEEMFTFPGDWSTDSRLCLKATAPLPVTLLAAIVSMEAHQS